MIRASVLDVPAAPVALQVTGGRAFSLAPADPRRRVPWPVAVAVETDRGDLATILATAGAVYDVGARITGARAYQPGGGIGSYLLTVADEGAHLRSPNPLRREDPLNVWSMLANPRDMLGTTNEADWWLPIVTVPEGAKSGVFYALDAGPWVVSYQVRIHDPAGAELPVPFGFSYWSGFPAATFDVGEVAALVAFGERFGGTSNAFYVTDGLVSGGNPIDRTRIHLPEAPPAGSSVRFLMRCASAAPNFLPAGALRLLVHWWS